MKSSYFDISDRDDSTQYTIRLTEVAVVSYGGGVLSIWLRHIPAPLTIRCSAEKADDFTSAVKAGYASNVWKQHKNKKR